MQTMHPMFVAGIITGSALLTFSLVSRNHIETMCTRSATSIGIILMLMGLVLAVQYYGTSRDFGCVGLTDLLRVILGWAFLAALYLRFRLFRILVLHCGGIRFFAIYVALVVPTSWEFPNNDELVWATYVGCYMGSLISVPCAIYVVLNGAIGQRGDAGEDRDF